MKSALRIFPRLAGFARPLRTLRPSNLRFLDPERCRSHTRATERGVKVECDQHSAFGVWRLAFRVWRSAFGICSPARPRTSSDLFAAPLLISIVLAVLTPSTPAADKNGVSPNAISLPSGPGSIEGLGDSFQPALNSGTMHYEFPFALPPGPAGHAPTLHLSYEGGQGNGPLGIGWTLPLPFVQRQTDKGIPRYVDAANGLDDDRDGEIDEADELDLFINDTKEELVPIANGNYFSKNEAAFIRYRRLDNHWEGTLPDGTRMDFGLTPSGRIVDPSNTNHIFKWLLERQTDTHGNTITFTWAVFPDASNLNQKYLQEIRYGAGAPPWSAFHFVAFAYDDRVDWFEDGRPGFLVRTGKRLREVIVGTQGATPAGHTVGDFNLDGSPDVLNRRYHLTYLAPVAGQTPWSLLTELTQFGSDDISPLPPVRFDYALCQPPVSVSAASQLIGGTNEPPFAVDNTNVELADLNGDGLPDLLRTGAAGGVHVAYLNRGEQTNGSGHVIAWSPAQALTSVDGLAWAVNLQSAQDVATLSDMNGDGLADLTFKSAVGDVFYFANQGNLGWDKRQLMNAQDSQPPAPIGNLNVRSADLDFNKHIDVIESIATGNGADYRIWFNLGQHRYARSITVPQLQGFLFSWSGVQIADFNGDRVPDIIRIQASTIVVTAGLGYGNFAPAVTVPIPDATLDATQIGKSRLVDINHDGLVDLVLERAAPGQIWYWLNQGNATLAPRRMITGLPGGLSTITRWADLNGDGVTDLLYADSAGTPKMLTVDLGRLLGCVPAPNTLTRIENGLGKIVRIEYAPSTQFALADAAVGNSWTNPLPFPITVVARTLTDDSLGHTYETRFRYHQGYYDAAEKEFRGFASAEQIEVGEASAPTLVSQSWFDVGRQFEAMKGKRLRLQLQQETGEIFSDETTAWASPPTTLYQGTNGHKVSFVHPTGSTKRVVELGHGIERSTETEQAYDTYGNQTLDADYGMVENGNRSASDDERITVHEFALNLDAWLVRRPSRTEIRDEHGTVISRTDFFYDDETFAGNNAGQVQRGNLTLRRDWIDPGQPGAYVASTRSQYDTYGNPLVQFDPLAVAAGGTPNPSAGHYREVSYDSVFHTYATFERVHIGSGKTPLLLQAEHDAGFGNIIASRDYSSQETTYHYDVFARLTQIVRPGDDPAYPSSEYAYALAQSNAPARLVNFVETRSLDKSPGSAATQREHYHISRQFTDGLGRALMVRQEAEPAPNSSQPRVIIKTASLFNARQKPATVLQPCFSTGTGSLDEQLAYEDVSAPGWHGLFHRDGQLVALDLNASDKNTIRYDALLREVAKTNADGTFTRTEFEPFLERRFDEDDNDPTSTHQDTPTLNFQDGLGRHIRTDELVRLNDDGTPSAVLNTWTTTYVFDLNDQLLRITDAQGNVKEMTVDSLKRLRSVDDPDRGRCTFVYDAASNRIETRDAKNQRITFTYDGANRLLTEDYHDEDQPLSAGFHFDPSIPLNATNRPDVAYFYDTPVPNLDFGDGTTGTAQNTEGLLAYVWDLSGEEHRSYDSRHRLAWTVKRIREPGPGKLVSYRTQEQHDPLDRLVQLTYPDNDSVSYHYNDRILLSRITGTQAGDIIEGIEYLPSGQPATTRYGNGLRTSYRYDRRARLTRLVTAHALNPTEPYVAFDYTFDPVSNIASIQDQRPASAIPSGDPRRNTQQFAYDDLNRLILARYSRALPGQTSHDGELHYRYDRIGNLVAQTSDIQHLEAGRSLTDLGTFTYGGAAGSSGRVGRSIVDPGPHALSQVGAETLEYDADGNVVQQGGANLTFDFRDQLVAVETATTRADYTYDFQHRRVIKRIVARSTNSPTPAPDITFYISPNFEVRPSDAPVKYVWNGATRVARISGSLSHNFRTQRCRLSPGWNLIALSVSVNNLATTLAPAIPANPDRPLLTETFRWDIATQTMKAIAPSDAGPAGTLLWLKAASAGTLGITGSFVEPTSGLSLDSPGFVSSSSFAPLPLDRGVGTDALSAWFYDANAQTWLSRLPAPLTSAGAFPKSLAPGQAIFLNPQGSFSVPMPDPALRLRYYHPDHLGSASVLTDEAGQLVEETAYYPYGLVRHAHLPRAVQDAYHYGQKEYDTESGLHYFEARYLAGRVGRFITVDPAFVEPQQPGGSRFQELLAHPQQLNLYAYAHNNPLVYVDPSGYDPDTTTPQPSPQQPLPRRNILPWKGTTSTEITVLAGHGIWAKANEIGHDAKGGLVYTGKDYQDSGYTVVPEGTTITFYCAHGNTISQELGNKIETQRLNAKQTRITYYPGDKIPNYALVQPQGLATHKVPGVNLVTVAQPTSLKELLKPGMGAVHWAACRETLNDKPTFVDDLDYVSPTKMPWEK